MIHIITSENRHLYGPQLWAMHEERRRQCVEKNGWVDMVVLDGGEVDDYDDHRAIYLLGFDGFMRLEVGLRLRPTDDRCMLADKFPHLIASGETSKKGVDVWEATRLSHHRDLSPAQGLGSRRAGVRMLGRRLRAGPASRREPLRRHDRHAAVSRHSELADRHPPGRDSAPLLVRPGGRFGDRHLPRRCWTGCWRRSGASRRSATRSTRWT
ncbi:acyl-homoserine-lactone synthase [Caulobacter segnis]